MFTVGLALISGRKVCHFVGVFQSFELITSILVMSQGPYGAKGPTGVAGITGRRGLQGNPYGPQGLNFFEPGARITTATTTTNPIVVGPTGYATYYLVGITGSQGPTGITGAFGLTGYIRTVQLPASMNSADAGAFWVFKNNTEKILQVDLSNGTANYKGNNTATSLYVGYDNSLGLAYSGTGTSYIAL